MLTQTGVKLMFEPLANPKSTQNAIVRPKTVLELSLRDADEESKVAGSQKHNEDITHSDSARSMALNRPILSASKPGSQRPKAEPAFKIAMIWYAKLVDMAPELRLYAVTYEIGTKRP